jgi:hypothetical protein
MIARGPTAAKGGSMKAFVVILSILLTLACNGSGQEKVENLNNKVPAVSPSPATEQPKPAANECRICDFDFAAYRGELKKEEIDGLLLALNDEYMAWATYDKINKQFNDPRPFVNIQQSEARHIERLKEIFAAYKVPVPANPWPGNTPKFESVSAACKAGVDAEIVNRDLYDRLFKTTAREDILIVYRNLQRASEQNHLPAFKRCGEGPGGGRRGQGAGGPPF